VKSILNFSLSGGAGRRVPFTHVEVESQDRAPSLAGPAKRQHRTTSRIAPGSAGCVPSPLRPTDRPPSGTTLGLSFCLTRRPRPSPLRDVRYLCLSKSSRTQGRTQHRYAKSIDSYRLATKGPPPPGHIIVHDLPNPAPSAHGGESPARSRQTLPRPTAGLFRRTLPATPGQTPRLDGLEDARHGW
jgi:hypothetical protein